MKIYINRKPIKGPWGGGNKTLTALVNQLQKKHQIVYNLQPDIDIIFCFDPRHNGEGIWYQDFINYKIKYPKVKIVQRVGDVGTHSKPELNTLLKKIVTLGFTDHFIFPSIWSKKMIDHRDKNFTHIPNAPLKEFYSARKLKKSKIENSSIKIVTHHWSNNKKKGFAIYEKLGLYAKENNIDFHYYGRYSEKYSKDGISIHEPIDAKKLIDVLPYHDIYVTASIEEAGANHVLEAMACGIPVFYHVAGGSISEYCKDYGIAYKDFDELIDKIHIVKENYKKFYDKNMLYNDNIENVIEKYVKAIERVHNEKS